MSCMENELKYISDTVIGENPFVAYWDNVISESSHTAKKIVGETMELIELMGLPQIQELAFKGRFKKVVYDAFNRSLDNQVTELRIGKELGDIPSVLELPNCKEHGKYENSKGSEGCPICVYNHSES